MEDLFTSQKILSQVNDGSIDKTLLAQRVIKNIENREKVTNESIFSVLIFFERIMRFEPNVLELDGPICLVADMHSQLFDMIKIIKTVEKEHKMKRFLFLGDYVDRGTYPVETFIYLCCRKILDPDNFFLIRGNHEAVGINSIYGLRDSCISKYNSVTIFNQFNEVFKALPLAAIVANSIFCVHAGISKFARNIEDICLIDRFVEIPNENGTENQIIVDLTWSDPDESVDSFIENENRGVGYVFGERHVKKFLKANDLSLVVRAHEVQPDGFRWYFNKTLLSLWSAPKYSECRSSKANYAIVDEKGKLKLYPITAADESDED